MIVITGGAGFIGSVLAHALQNEGEDLVICDRFDEREKWQNLRTVQVERFLEPNELLEFLANEASNVRMVFHLGAISSTTVRDARSVLRDNFDFSCRLWQVCAARNCCLVYASSAATYGDGSLGFDDSSASDDLAKLEPLNLYAWSKHLFDRWVARRIERREPQPPQWAGLKFFNVYGPNEYHKIGQESVVFNAFRQISTSGTVSLFRSTVPDLADGEQSRDFVWVGDCVDVMRWLLHRPEVTGLYNLGTGRARSFNDLVRATFAALQRPENVEYIDMPDSLRSRYQSFTEAPISRLRSAGYDRPFRSLEQGVTSYVQDYLNTDDPYL